MTLQESARIVSEELAALPPVQMETCEVKVKPERWPELEHKMKEREPVTMILGAEITQWNVSELTWRDGFLTAKLYRGIEES